MNPLLVAGRQCEFVDAVLRHFHPVADTDLRADGALQLFKPVENPHGFDPFLRTFYSFISGTLSGTVSSASVTASTSATLTPGAVSCSVALPPGKAMTAISVTTRSTGRTEVSGRLHLGTILDLPLAACCIATSTRLAPLTRSMAPPMPGTILPGIIQLARRPPASTCKPPSTVMSTCPPRIRPNDIAL